ncbi:diguanylate cyclase (GGDEF)-like protein [Rhodopseudomonas julia]|uniref:Diguanylate cyclase (GGDEF)-like protein n=1 Tax=Rhodopseudomonas julia TaxID=200617 RepID=A0ABU0CCR6_9BRAD|nr:EAL domain-containing protein [Rhodopseudomonas julia]MDQ0327425.1 diguanylate cyclase (GGDEF)-like protein [Rhodopseudomonas julia]
MTAAQLQEAMCPCPANEQERLQEVLHYRFADGGSEKALDEICGLAQSLFEVPLAFVTLMDATEEVVLASCGAGDRPIPRSEAISSWAVLSDGVFVVEDALQDPRFHGNEWVQRRHLRFYAGAPLIVRPGVAVGTLCLIDTRPRHLSAGETERLAMLASLAMNELSRRRTIIDLRRQKRLLAQATRLTKVGSWKLDVRNDSLTWSEEMYRIFELDRRVNPTREFFKQTLSSASDADAQQAVTALVQEGKRFDHEVEITTAKGHRRWIRCLAEAEWSDGRVAHVIGSVQDVTEQHQHNAEIERLAFRDGLTGLPNRALFHERLSGAIAHARETRTSVGLIMLDLDHFKTVNDTLGHDAGDLLLCLIGERLQRVFGQNNTVARLGGDEFAIIMPGIKTAADIHKAVERVMELLRHPVEHDGRNFSITASAGAAMCPQHHENPTDLLKNADIALFRAKLAGRNRLIGFQPWMRLAVERRAELMQDVRSSLKENRFKLFYQPTVSLADSCQVTGLEALMRWEHPSKGLLTPAAFISAFEDSECGHQLGELAFDSAIDQMRRWLDDGVEFGRVAINLSSAQFRSGNLTEVILDKLAAAGVPPSRLVLEVTENTYMGWSAEMVGDALRALHIAGIKIALDDFGTGYASLTHLNQFPIDRLKIDKSFLRGTSDGAIVHAIVTLGARLGMTVVAEGVEDAEQLAILREMKCDEAQGYYFARPMPADDVPAFLNEFRGRSDGEDMTALANPQILGRFDETQQSTCA